MNSLLYVPDFDGTPKNLVGVSTDESSSVTDRVLTSGGSKLDDGMLLDTFAETADLPELTITDALRGMVARKIQRLGLKTNGAELALSIADMLQRTHATNRPDSIMPPDMTQAMALMRERLEATPPHKRWNLGMQLGDRAVHFGAGFTGSRSIAKIMGDQERQNYAEGMAYAGYSAARASMPRAHHLFRLEPLMYRFGHAAKVVAALYQEGDIDPNKPDPWAGIDLAKTC